VRKILCYDIESKVLNNKISGNTDVFRTISMYEVEEDKYHFYTYTQIQAIQAVFNKHRVLIGHSIKNYDNPVLIRAGINLQYHLILDTYEIAKKRAQFLGIQNESKSLSNLAKFFKLKHYKDDDFDYEILSKCEWTKEELRLIRKYNENDVKVTYELFKYMSNFFEPFKEYMNDKDKRDHKWLTTTIAAYVYKVICHKTGLKEEYDDNTKYEKYDGGFVLEPTIKEEHNNVICFDFNSLYPNIMIQCNLFSNNCKCCNDKEKWSGDNFFNVKGKYCSKNLGVIEKFVKKLYLQRVEYKKNKDKREHVLKIIINSLYGCVGSPVFKSIHNYVSASDCTSIGRDCIRFAIKTFDEFDFNVLYGDTDSIFIKIPDNKTKEDAMIVANYVVNKLQSHMPFPY